MAASSRWLVAVPVKTTLWVIVLPSPYLPSDPFYEREAERMAKSVAWKKSGESDCLRA